MNHPMNPGISPDGVGDFLVSRRKPVPKEEDPPPGARHEAFTPTLLGLVHDQDEVSPKGEV